MAERVLALKASKPAVPDAPSILNALAAAVVVVGPADEILYVNGAGEQLFQSSAAHLKGQKLDALLPADSPLVALIRQARADGAPVSEHGIAVATPRIGSHSFNVQVAPLPESSGSVAAILTERSIAERIDRQLSHRGAARSLTAMGAMLAHEVKNPLAGIRGAAQLLERVVAPEERTLTTLIRDEADRICALVDRMEVFAESGAPHREAVNIHQVLDRVRRVAETGFARHVRFVETYDPSLPPVLGDRDQMMQVFVNLVKNAAEAAPPEAGEVHLGTAYRHGLRMAVAGSGARVHLPLVVTVQDNGDGIPEDIQPYLFDPFVTSKPKGSGLGLALVAKIVGDHGGVVEFESRPGRTLFRVLLPVWIEGGEGG